MQIQIYKYQYQKIDKIGKYKINKSGSLTILKKIANITI